MKREPHKTGPRNSRQRLAACQTGTEDRRSSPRDDRIVAQLIKAALNRELPALYEQLPRVRKMKSLAVLAEAVGDQETAGNIRRCLGQLAAEVDA